MIIAINHITLGVTYIEKSFIFNRDVLGLMPLVKWDKNAYFLLVKLVANRMNATEMLDVFKEYILQEKFNE